MNDNGGKLGIYRKEMEMEARKGDLKLSGRRKKWSFSKSFLLITKLPSKKFIKNCFAEVKIRTHKVKRVRDERFQIENPNFILHQVRFELVTSPRVDG